MSQQSHSIMKRRNFLSIVSDWSWSYFLCFYIPYICIFLNTLMFFFVCTMKLIFLHFTYLYGTWCIPFRNCWSYERTKFCSRSFRTLTWRKLVPRLLDTRLVCILAPIKWLAIFSTSVWDFGSFLLGYPHITQFEWLQKIQNKWLFFIFSNNNADFSLF